MLRSLMAGVSGIKAHQTMLDVTGNNIANVNTTGFKKSVTNFQDLLYQTGRGATAPDTEGGRGGVNALQVGLGVMVASIETIHSQGNLNYTGNRTDMAVQGDGYFVIRDGQNTLYTRSGAMVLDGDGNVVQSGTGYMLQGFGMEPDPNDPTNFIEGTTLAGINIPIGKKLEARPTEVVGFRCNLDSRVDTYLPMGFTGNDVRSTATLNGAEYAITVAEGNGSGNDGAGNLSAPANAMITMNLTPAAGVATPLYFGFTGITNDGYPQLGMALAAGNPLVSDATPLPLGIGTTEARYDNTTGILSIYDNAAPAGVELWRMDMRGLMDYQSFTVTDGTNTARVLAEYDDNPVDGSRVMRMLWTSDVAATPISNDTDGIPMRTFAMNQDGTFRAILAADEETAWFNSIGGAALPNTGWPGAGLAALFTDGAAGDGLAMRVAPNALGLEVRRADPGNALISTSTQRLDSVHETKIEIYDSLGNPHTLEVSWEKIDNNQWRWRAWFPSDNIAILNSTGVIDFDSEGKIEGSAVPTVRALFGAIGAEDMDIRLDFSGESFGNPPIDGVTQFGSAMTTKGYYQDGYRMGVLNDFSVGADGTVTGVYDNGRTQPMYKVALALFANAQGLLKVGETEFAQSPNSGVAQIVSPQTGGAGKIMGGNLEMSNVDLSEEFVTLIKGQRGFQANARVVTTGDQVLEELINIKR